MKWKSQVEGDIVASPDITIIKSAKQPEPVAPPVNKYPNNY